MLSLLLLKSTVKMTKMLTLFAQSLVWESEQWKRHIILKRISEYVLLRHLSVSKENIMHIVDQLDFSLLYGAGGN